MTGPRLSIDYYPPGEVLRTFLASDAFVRVIRGPIGSGKSTGCAYELVRRAMMQAPGPDGVRRTRWAIVRNTLPELRATTMATWFALVPQHLGRFQSEGPAMFTLSGADFCMEVLFLALDSPEDVRKVLSLELTGAWINECREVAKQNFDALTGRVGRFPALKDGGPTWFGIIADTNPSDTDHWLYHLAEEQQPNGFEFFAQPSGLSPQAENVANLPRGYYDRACLGKGVDWIKCYVHGEYANVANGKPVWPEYADSTHCKPVQFARALPLRIGMDFGLTPAAVIGQRGPMGDWRVLSEVVCEDASALHFAEMLKRHLAERYSDAPIASITGDPAGEARSQTDGRTVFQILRVAGVHARPAPSNDFTLRREVVAKALTRLVGGQPGFALSPECKRLRKAMASGYSYKRVHVSGERYRDAPDKDEHSHVADALQYLLIGAGEGATVMRAPQSPSQGIRPRFSVTDYPVITT